MKFACRPVELDFFDRAAYRLVKAADLEASAHEVFALLGEAATWPAFFDEIKHVEWTTPLPRDAGTTRTVTLDLMRAWETYLRWEEGQRFSFRFDAVSLPAFGAFGEDYMLADTSPGRSRLVWTIAWEPSWVTRLAPGLLERELDSMFSRATRSLESYVRATASGQDQ